MKKKNLIFYVNKLCTTDGGICIRILPHPEESSAIWIPWNDQTHTPDWWGQVQKNQKQTLLINSIRAKLREYSEYEQFKLIFNKEEFTLAGNPYFGGEKRKEYLDQHFKMLPEDIAFINNKLFLSVIS